MLIELHCSSIICYLCWQEDIYEYAANYEITVDKFKCKKIIEKKDSTTTYDHLVCKVYPLQEE